MNKGEYKEGTYVLRAKIDMNSDNLNMRDPVIYRIISYKKNNKIISKKI